MHNSTKGKNNVAKLETRHHAEFNLINAAEEEREMIILGHQ